MGDVVLTNNFSILGGSKTGHVVFHLRKCMIQERRAHLKREKRNDISVLTKEINLDLQSVD